MGATTAAARIVQFGTSRFLQAHVDLFAHEASQSGQSVCPITVVQSSGAAERAGRVSAFGTPYRVIIRGLQAGEPVDRTILVDSVDRGLSAERDWGSLLALFADDAVAVVSNTGERGYELAASDRGPGLLDGKVPASFPGKLTALLHARWRGGAKPLLVLPCELLPDNGAVLRHLVLGLARDAQAPESFLAWLTAKVVWANTLVDRIVSEALEPIGAVAEPYALWAVERQPGLRLPFDHPSVLMVDDLEPYERLKLHILNLGHTVLADRWLQSGARPGDTVRGMLDDAAVTASLEGLYQTEVLPGFARRKMEDTARTYVAATVERFRNPFLDHRLADIAQNHAAKVDRRIGGFRDWVAETGEKLAMPRLEAVLARKDARPPA